MKQIKVITAILLILTMLCGCWDQNIYEKIGFILQIGFDKGTSNEKIMYTVTYPIISEAESGNGGKADGSEKKVDVISEEAYLIRESRDLGRLTSTKQLEGGKIQNLLFSSDLAKERKISEYLELYERDTQSTVQATVIIVDGSAKELLTNGAEFKGKPRLGIYLTDLIDRNFKAGYCPEINIVRYNILNVKPGISPIVPLIKLEENDVRILGSALIDRDKMTGRLDTRETACLFMVMGKSKLSEIIFDLPKDTDTQKSKGIIFTRKVKSNQRIHFENNVPQIDFSINLKATLDEYSWGHITDQAFESKMEQCVSASITETLNEVFEKLQDAQCDVLGIGDKIRAYHNEYWKSIGELEGWKKLYPQIKFCCNIKVDIIRYGEIR